MISTKLILKDFYMENNKTIFSKVKFYFFLKKIERKLNEPIDTLTDGRTYQEFMEHKEESFIIPFSEKSIILFWKSKDFNSGKQIVVCPNNLIDHGVLNIDMLRQTYS